MKYNINIQKNNKLFFIRDNINIPRIEYSIICICSIISRYIYTRDYI
jgi:hypothetical protein